MERCANTEAIDRYYREQEDERAQYEYELAGYKEDLYDMMQEVLHFIHNKDEQFIEDLREYAEGLL